MLASSATRSRPSWPWIALCALPFAALVWRFDFLCDDAYISFRYARHLAQGLGLRYNPGEQPPVEGFTNLLWVLVLAPFERLGPGSPIASRVLSAGCGLCLLALLGRHLAQLSRGERGVFVPALLFAATFPPLAAWATGGLETMAFTLAVFGLYDGLLAPDGRLRRAQAGLAGAATLLLRADGFAWVAMVLAAALLRAWTCRSRALARATLVLGGLLVLASLALVLWRWWFFEALAPNTARIKVALGATAIERGARYLASFLVSFPSALAVVIIASATLLRSRAAAAWPAAAIALGNCAYVVLVGGDFMAMGRFLVPSVPFLAVLFALSLQRLHSSGLLRARVATGVWALVVALSLLSAYDVRVLPRRLLEALDFRWSSQVFRTEVEKWRTMKERARTWAVQGRMLARIAAPGDSLVIGTIGAVGYFSGLVIHDPMGLVNREQLVDEGAQDGPRRSAGHERRVPLATFVAQQPTFLEARFTPAQQPLLMLPVPLQPGGELAAHARLEWIAPLPEDGVPAGVVLRIVRFVP